MRHAAYEELDCVQCAVKFTAGAYATNTVRSCRGSSTQSAEIAVERLGRRLFGDRYVRAEQIGTGGTCESTWLVLGHKSPTHSNR